MRAGPTICVLGTHHGGTAAVAGLLELLGFSLGDTERRLDPTSPAGAGCSGNRRIVEVSEAILLRLGGTFADPPELRAGWHASAALDDLRSHAVRVVSEELGGAPLAAFEDPRVSLTAPFWRTLLPGLRAVLPFRSPLEVARSWSGFLGPAACYALWHRYLASALRHTEPEDRLLLPLSDVIDDPAETLRRIAAFAGVPVPEAAAEGARAGAPTGHGRSSLAETLAEPRLPVETKALYVSLRLAAGSPGETDELAAALGRLGDSTAPPRARRARGKPEARSIPAALLAPDAWGMEKADVVVLGIVPWSERWQRPHHLAYELTRRGHRVVYVTPHLGRERRRWRRLEEGACPEGVVLAQLGAVEKETIHRGTWDDADLAHAHHTFWRMVDDLRLRCPILLVESPAWWPLVSWLRERADFPVVYDCLDEHTGWNQEIAADLRAFESELARSAELVLASAPLLERRLRELTDRVVLVPNGCDPERFAQAGEGNGVLRPPLAGPIVGYYGAVSAGWFDTGLVLALAEARPEWSIVLVGPVDDETRDALDPAPNVLQLGEVPYEELPRYCADFDVAIVPFLVNDLTAATDPVKLYEYFAAGKPVVTTPLPAVYPYQGLLRVAESASAFARAIEGFLHDPGDREERRRVAREAAWSLRLDAFYERMLACLPSLDVVVLAHEGAALTRRCVESVLRDPSYRARLVVVDNASTDATGELLDGLERRSAATVIRNERNVGFAAGLNVGIRAGDGGYVLVLNNDTELASGSLLGFVHALARSRDVGLAGAVTNSIGNEAQIDAPYDVDVPGELDRWFRELAWTRFGLSFDVAVCALFAAVARRADLEAVGLVPERYQVGMFEDDELADRIRALGKRVVCAEDVFVHHSGGAAFRSLDPVVYRAVFDRNRRLFERAAGRQWHPHSYRPDQRAPVAEREQGEG